MIYSFEELFPRSGCEGPISTRFYFHGGKKIQLVWNEPELILWILRNFYKSLLIVALRKIKGANSTRIYFHDVTQFSWSRDLDAITNGKTNIYPRNNRGRMLHANIKNHGIPEICISHKIWKNGKIMI